MIVAVLSALAGSYWSVDLSALPLLLQVELLIGSLFVDILAPDGILIASVTVLGIPAALVGARIAAMLTARNVA